MTRRWIFFSCIFLFALASNASEKTTNYAAAKQLASEFNKPILIDFMTEW